MTEQTRRHFLEVAAATAAATLLPAPALAAPRVASGAALLPTADSPLPVGPGAPYGTYQSEIYIAGMSADVEPIFTTNLSDLEAAANKVLSERARRHLLAWAGGAERRTSERASAGHLAHRPADVPRPLRARPHHDGARRGHARTGHPRPRRAPGPGPPRR